MSSLLGDHYGACFDAYVSFFSHKDGFHDPDVYSHYNTTILRNGRRVRLNNETIDRFGVLVTGQHMDTIRKAITGDSIMHYDLDTSASSPEAITFDMRSENGYKLMKVEFETQFVEEVLITIERADDRPCCICK
ncbi:hypothetical protein DPMN_060815 [Dreissena polymorpha]|uniref:Uncharacterized protein n=1 Tax=Dreissena polymorpha TaxID=45954 RepID=A0A9D4C6P3_DREPO|nr:hypothetical protein DPMN_060815 [Dreissena polymorpha]